MDPELVECLYLVKNGVPYDVAFSLPPAERFAYFLTFAEFDGNQWDWNAMAFVERR